MYKPKVTKDDFSAWFTEHPGASIDEICDTFNVSVSCAYAKRKQYYSEHRYDPNSTKIGATIFQSGYDTGFIAGATVGILAGDLLKSQGLGVSDILQRVSAWMKPPSEPAGSS